MELYLSPPLTVVLAIHQNIIVSFFWVFTSWKTEIYHEFRLNYFRSDWMVFNRVVTFRTHKWERMKKEHQEVRIYDQLFYSNILYMKKTVCERRNSGWMSFNVKRNLKLCQMLEIYRKTMYLDLMIIWKLPKKLCTNLDNCSFM